MNVNVLPNYPVAGSYADISEINCPQIGSQNNVECFLPAIFDELKKSKWFTIILSFLAIISLFNFALVCWTISCLQLGSLGLGNGNIALTDEGISMFSNVYLNHPLSSKLVQSYDAEKVVLIGSKQLEVAISDDKSSSRLELDNLDNNNGEIKFISDKIQVYRTTHDHKQLDFSLDSGKLTISAPETVKSSLWGGFKMWQNLQTKSIKGNFQSDLRIESRTQSMDIKSHKQLTISSSIGNIKATSLQDCRISSNKLLIDSESINLNRLPLLKAPRHGHKNHTSQLTGYQVCVCNNGALFLAPEMGTCHASSEFCSANHIKNHIY